MLFFNWLKRAHAPQTPVALREQAHTLPYTLVMYARSKPCPFVTSARRTLARLNVPYRELLIDCDEEARQRVLAWTGFESVPTLVLAQAGQVVPYEDVPPLPNGQSPRGVMRGAMLTEPSDSQLEAWLRAYGLLA
jgi:glutaredoxin